MSKEFSKQDIGSSLLFICFKRNVSLHLFTRMISMDFFGDPNVFPHYYVQIPLSKQ